APALTTLQAGGGGATTLTSGTAPELVGGLTYTNEFISSLNGLGFNGIPTGAVRLVDLNPAAAETATWNGNVALAGGTAIAVQGSTDALILGGAGQAQGQITGNQTLTKYGLGTLELGGLAPDPNASGWNVNEGALRLNKAAGVQALAAGG